MSRLLLRLFVLVYHLPYRVHHGRLLLPMLYLLLFLEMLLLHLLPFLLRLLLHSQGLQYLRHVLFGHRHRGCKELTRGNSWIKVASQPQGSATMKVHGCFLD